jgi:hypothetical protein
MRVRPASVFYCALALFCWRSAEAQTLAAPKAITLNGIVVDAEKAPIADAELSLKPFGQTARSVRSGTDGHFSFDGLPAGEGSMTIRRLGYRQRIMPVDVVAGTSAQMEVSLDQIAEDLDDVTIDASSGRMAEFTNHRQNSSFGHFFDQHDIQKIAPRFTSELFRSVPGATVQVASGIGNRVLLRGCKPRVWVNGVRTVNTEVDEVAAPSEIDGIEIYPSMAGTPSQYMDRENRACGTVIIWTRR